ncbi:hypothetical protein [Bradyrhizobium japonicum]|uniref:hypothetical protein n=1 Tax=Bradyrhizobium japonicum TaxID=375 RepID=UPI000456D518|nr:hypothetical protein [Bradyrhizobium japonicum]AHY52903.1 hypothetical protein BJS_00276 [Bradyrhizobium japonicum SEMIA 5079]MCD9108415.1 hypothetical protein [Bradyrhizobium japonicum]MCD9259378.1 hypothetical protein [Bradyrhizobium japonicum SEMIA 5079]MCD9823713.1 hypothetical protein [Bradyrhizobium japonicum]MCD9896009.1 hypothetical protein [Bradyrhizobium japonicum]
MSDKMQLVVATPCFGRQVSTIYASSVFALQRAVHGVPNLELKVLLRDGDALITRARANLVAMFLDSHDTLAGSQNRFALFECMIDPATGTYLSEDFAFCKRWTDIGGEIWADIESSLDHVGPSVFHGDIASQFAAAPAAAADAA